MSDWQANLLRQVHDRPQQRQNPTTVFEGRANLIQLRVAQGFNGFLNDAARVRGVNRSAYLRRAAAVLIAHDLGLDVHAILALCPIPSPYAATGRQLYRTGLVDTGEGIEQWCPHPGCDGTHLCDS